MYFLKWKINSLNMELILFFHSIYRPDFTWFDSMQQGLGFPENVVFSPAVFNHASQTAESEHD